MMPCLQHFNLSSPSQTLSILKTQFTCRNSLQWDVIVLRQYWRLLVSNTYYLHVFTWHEWDEWNICWTERASVTAIQFVQEGPVLQTSFFLQRQHRAVHSLCSLSWYHLSSWPWQLSKLTKSLLCVSSSNSESSTYLASSSFIYRSIVTLSL